MKEAGSAVAIPRLTTKGTPYGKRFKAYYI